MTKPTDTDGLSREELLDRLASAEARNRRFEDIIACVPGFAWEAVGLPWDPAYRVTFISPQAEALLGYGIDEWLGTPNFWLIALHPEDRVRIPTSLPPGTTAFPARTELRFVTKDGRLVWLETHPVVVKDEAGRPVGIRGVTIDVTARKDAERARKELEEAQAAARLREEMMRAHAATLSELSTPLIPISDEVVVMPLIGGLDGERAERVIQVLLDGIGRTRARVAILDITGVPSVNSSVADALVRAAKAVRLLGAEAVLTGIRPEVAQTLIALGTDLGDIVTRGSLQSGIAYAMTRR